MEQRTTEAKFAVRYLLDYRIMLALDRHLLGTRHWKQAAISAVLAAYWSIVSAFDSSVFLPRPVCLAGACFLWFWAFWSLLLPRRVARKQMRAWNPAAGEETYWFAEDAVRDVDSLSERTYSYSAFVKLKESEENFFLYVSPTRAHILPKRAFVQGDPADFPAFIMARSGAQYETCKY